MWGELKFTVIINATVAMPGSRWSAITSIVYSYKKPVCTSITLGYDFLLTIEREVDLPEGTGGERV